MSKVATLWLALLTTGCLFDANSLGPPPPLAGKTLDGVTPNLKWDYAIFFRPDATYSWTWTERVPVTDSHAGDYTAGRHGTEDGSWQVTWGTLWLQTPMTLVKYEGWVLTMTILTSTAHQEIGSSAAYPLTYTGTVYIFASVLWHERTT